jgi:hypothetical protein
MASEQSEKVVRLTLNSSGFAVPDQDPVRVQKANQKIRWCADFEFTIDMPEYTDMKYGNGGASDCKFRCTTGTFPDVRKYKYSIVANGKTNDPEVDVFP